MLINTTAIDGRICEIAEELPIVEDIIMSGSLAGADVQGEREYCANLIKERDTLKADLVEYYKLNS